MDLWLQLLVVPLILAGLGFLFTAQQDARQQATDQDAKLQAYLDQMSALLIDENLRSSDEGSEVRTLARAQTLTVLEAVDPERRAQVLLFLEVAKLVQRLGQQKRPVVSLGRADLQGVVLSGADLRGAELWTADLKDAT